MTNLRDEVLRALLSRGEATMTELAAQVKRSPPVVYHHLVSLVQEGMVARDDSAGRPIYRPLEFVSVTWVDPKTRRLDRWAASGGISWQFPLVSRIADLRARNTVLQFLLRAEARGLFVRPHLLTGEARRGRATKGRSRGADPGRAYGLRVVVYGSAARGDLGPNSDVDLVVLQGPSHDASALIDDLAAEVNLESERRLDVRTIKDATKLSGTLRDNIELEGRLVFSTYEDGYHEPIFGGTLE